MANENELLTYLGAIKIIHLFVFTAAGPQLAEATTVAEEVVVIE